jgi:DNA-binding IclR family transcriptional regulator
MSDIGGSAVEILVKADEILEFLRQRGEMTVAQIADGVDEPRSSVYRLLATLEEIEFVEANQDGRFQLGLRLFALSKIVATHLLIVPAARPTMEDLSDRTGETVFLVARYGFEAVCLERLDGARVQSMAPEIGGSLPLHIGAGPQVLLANAEPELIDKYLSGDLEKRTEHSIVDRNEWRSRLAEIRETGSAISDEDLVPGIAAVGSPIRDASGSVVAALALAGTRASLLGPSRDEMVKIVRDSAAKIVAPGPAR